MKNVSSSAPAVAAQPKPATRTRAPRRFFPRIMPLADEYLASKVAGAAWQGLMWFAGLFVLFAIATSAKKIAQDHVPFMVAVQGILLQMPRIVLFTIPAALLYGTVQTFVDMSSKGEITALMAGGISLPRMLRAPLIFAALCAVFAFYLQEVLVPGAELSKNQLLTDAVQQLGVQEGFSIIEKYNDGSIKRLVQAKSFDPKSRILVEPSVLLLRPDGSIQLHLKAQRAVWDQANGTWTFFNGQSREETGDLNKTYSVPTSFSEMQLNIGAPKKLGSEARGAAEQIGAHNYEMVSVKDLFRHRRSLLRAAAAEGSTGSLSKEVNSLTYGIHDKFATPLVCLAMVLIGAPLGIRPQRTAAAGLAMGLSLAVLILYYLVWTICQQTGKGGAPLPLLFAYLPFFITTGIGLGLVKQKT